MRKVAKTRKAIAKEYGVHPRTLKRWLTKAQIELPRGLVKPIHQNMIYSRFGWPSHLVTGMVI